MEEKDITKTLFTPKIRITICVYLRTKNLLETSFFFFLSYLFFKLFYSCHLLHHGILFSRANKNCPKYPRELYQREACSFPQCYNFISSWISLTGLVCFFATLKWENAFSTFFAVGNLLSISGTDIRPANLFYSYSVKDNQGKTPMTSQNPNNNDFFILWGPNTKI